MGGEELALNLYSVQRLKDNPCVLPFATGARMCVGRALAYLEARVLASTLLPEMELAPISTSTNLQEQTRESSYLCDLTRPKYVSRSCSHCPLLSDWSMCDSTFESTLLCGVPAIQLQHRCTAQGTGFPFFINV